MPSYENPGWRDPSIVMSSDVRKSLEAAARNAGASRRDAEIGAAWLTLRTRYPSGVINGVNPKGLITKTVPWAAAKAYTADRLRGVDDARVRDVLAGASGGPIHGAGRRDEAGPSVEEAFGRLSRGDRRPKVTLAETAHRLGVSEPTARKRLGLAIGRLRKEVFRILSL